MSAGKSLLAGDDVPAAYARCVQITRREARNFYYGIALLPPRKRLALAAVYALARRIDDIGDGAEPVEVRLQRLDEVCRDLASIEDPDRQPVRDPVLVALADAASQLPVELGDFEDLVDGCRADVVGHRYRTEADLRWYCGRVAGSVGRLSVGVYDPLDLGRARRLGDTLGLALQLTNILRDLREDRHLGRVYLPAEDLERFGCTLTLDAAGDLADPPGAFDALVRFQVERARAWYAEGLALLPLLDHRSAACTAAMAGIYRRLLEQIAAEPDRVRWQRLSLSRTAKTRVAVRALVRGRA